MRCGGTVLVTAMSVICSGFLAACRARASIWSRTRAMFSAMLMKGKNYHRTLRYTMEGGIKQAAMPRLTVVNGCNLATWQMSPTQGETSSTRNRDLQSSFGSHDCRGRRRFIGIARAGEG